MSKRKTLIKLSDTAKKLGISKKHLETSIMFEPEFPKRVRLVDGGDLFFVEQEIDDYIEMRKVE